MFSAAKTRHEATYRVDGAEEVAEARCELEKLVVLGKGLCWCGACSAETGNEERRKKGSSKFPSRTSKTSA